MCNNEDELFLLLKKKCTDLKKTNKFSTTDCYSIKKNIRIEMKCRKKHYQQLLIEKDKYDSIMINSEQTKFYICSTPEGIFSFDLTKIKQPNWQKMWLPKTTEFSNRNYILKDVGFIDIKDAKNITQNIMN